MNRYALLLFACFVAVLLSFAAMHAGVNGSSHHVQILDELHQVSYLDSQLNEDVLKSRYFLLASYDPMLDLTTKLRDLTDRLENPDSGVRGRYGAEVDEALATYIARLTEKLAVIESFKSKNAVLRNSIYFLPHSLDESAIPQNLKEPLLKGTLEYLLLGTPESRDEFARLLHSLPPDPRFAHFRLIWTEKPGLDALVARIAESPTREAMEKLVDAYLEHRQGAERQAGYFRAGVCLLSLSLLALVFAALFGIRRQAGLLERAVQARTQELLNVSKMSALGEMAAGVAHEINNPLAIIKTLAGQIQELTNDPVLDPPLLRELSAQVENTTDRIARIVTGMRSFSRDGSRDPFQSISVHTLIEDTLSLCSERLRNHGLDLRVENADSELRIKGQPTQLSQVLINLLNNSFDAIADQPYKWIRICASEESSGVKITVTDCGTGITPAVQAKLFQPFFTTKEIGKGTGLGLSISQGILRSHGGDLTVDPLSPNTCFVIRLPKSVPAPERSESPQLIKASG